MNTVNKSFLLFNTIFIVAQYCQAQNFILKANYPRHSAPPGKLYMARMGFFGSPKPKGMYQE